MAVPTIPNHLPATPTPIPSTKQPKGTLHPALDVTLWVISFIIGFCVVPYHDIFSGYHHEPPDLFKPLLFGVMAMFFIRYGAGALLGEKAGS